MKNFQYYIKNNKNIILSVSKKIWYNNLDYSLKEIEGMVYTAIWESKKEPTSIALYRTVLNRILGEKGFKYHNGSLLKNEINIESIDQISDRTSLGDYYDLINKSDYKFAINRLFLILNQEEVFVMALSFSLSTPSALKGQYKKILDNMEDVYYTRKLTKKEISAITNKSIKEIDNIRKTAMNKMEKRYEAN